MLKKFFVEWTITGRTEIQAKTSEEADTKFASFSPRELASDGEFEPTPAVSEEEEEAEWLSFSKAMERLRERKKAKAAN